MALFTGERWIVATDVLAKRSQSIKRVTAIRFERATAFGIRTLERDSQINVLMIQSSDHEDFKCLIYFGFQVRNGWLKCMEACRTARAVCVASHNPVLKTVAKRLKKRGKPHRLVIIAIARRLVTIENAILKTDISWRTSPIM